MALSKKKHDIIYIPKLK